MNSNEVYVSLDIGTSNVKVIIGEMTNGALNIIGVGTAKSEGIKKGSIVDIDLTVHSIKNAIEQAEKMVGLEIKNVIVGVSGNHISLQNSHGVVAVSGEKRVPEIDDQDIARVMEAAQVSIPLDRKIMDVIPKEFIVDGLSGITAPRGMIGVRLEMHGTIISGSKTVLHNIERCVQRAGLNVSYVCLEPLASGMTALSKDERNIGTALVDIGGGTTTVSIFDQGHLQAMVEIPVGGDHITKDISIGLKTTTDVAETLKLKYGHAFYDNASEDVVFQVPIIGGNKHVDKSQLEISDIIEARLVEILQLVELEVRKLGYKDLSGGYVLTGGVSSTEGLLDLASEVLQHHVRIAVPDYIGVREPQYTSSVGLIKFTDHLVKVQGKGKEVAAGIIEDIEVPIKKEKAPKKEKNTDALAKIKNWTKYFFE
ncbi:cell division protein FtsA [Lottiidibacillus patelloidae]|uniref:Cell division protein FtsA n=1 Tax=Lottiidibacillus patelloidae TaxID=2670334 RepID=A0A263BXQ3_9BACI|nr:cell division protein FtsA [Lottiidibacillus patelloidae]OZM58509.1 cell division protein FtsA [Lottiidibacillus patelloidae]